MIEPNPAPLNKKPILLLDETIQLSEQCYGQLNTEFAVYPWQEADSATLSQAKALLLHSRIGEEALSSLCNCRYIGVRAHNTDYVPHAYRHSNLTVTGIPQFGSQSVAEHTFALIFALAKNLTQSHVNTVEGAWRTGLPLNIEISGKTLAIVGYGKIGQSVARMARAFGLDVVVTAKPGEQPNDNQLALEDALRVADIVTIHTSTKTGVAPFWTRERLSHLKPTAILINTARGSLIDYDALGDMVINGQIAGVGLDVYPVEPPDLTWLNQPNVICSPHIAYYTDSTLSAMNSALVEQALAWHKAP